ncbi:MAG: DUF5615 family PIN-like protein [Isosphaeraceae bacterium]
MSSRRLAARLQSVGHDVLLASDVGLGSVSDARVLAWAVAQDRPVLTRDHEDFADLHDLVMAVVGHHPGILGRPIRQRSAAQPDRACNCNGDWEPGFFWGGGRRQDPRPESLALIVGQRPPVRLEKGTQLVIDSSCVPFSTRRFNCRERLPIHSKWKW